MPSLLVDRRVSASLLTASIMYDTRDGGMYTLGGRSDRPASTTQHNANPIRLGSQHAMLCYALAGSSCATATLSNAIESPTTLHPIVTLRPTATTSRHVDNLSAIVADS